MAQVQTELSDHTEDIKAVSRLCEMECTISQGGLMQYLTAISDPRGGEQYTLSDMVYREG